MAARHSKQLQACLLQPNSFRHRHGAQIRPEGFMIRHSDHNMYHVQPRLLTRGRQQQSGVKNMLRFFVLLTFVFRFGEASHPGPPCSGFVLGLLNPTGLLHKSDLINQLPQGSQGTTWLVSEIGNTPNPACLNSSSGPSSFPRALISCCMVIQCHPNSSTSLYMLCGAKKRGLGFSPVHLAERLCTYGHPISLRKIDAM